MLIICTYDEDTQLSLTSARELHTYTARHTGSIDKVKVDVWRKQYCCDYRETDTILEDLLLPTRGRHQGCGPCPTRAPHSGFRKSQRLHQRSP